VGTVVLLCLLFGSLLGGSCHYHGHRDDDDCRRDDDDGCHFATRGETPSEPVDGTSPPLGASSPYRLRVYEMVQPAGSRVPTIYTSIEGICLFTTSSTTVFGTEEILAFCQEILRANRDLLGPGEGRGDLRPRGADFSDQGVVARFSLTLPEAGGRVLEVDGPELVFRFDGLGNLCEIIDSTRLDLGRRAFDDVR
jgi:hypothetical protein